MRRFGVSLEEELLQRLDQVVKDQGLPSRSEAIRHLVRSQSAREDWAHDDHVAGCLVLVYEHQRRELLGRMTELQHEHHELILTCQHVHVSHELCLETILMKGTASKLQALADQLSALKGVHQGTLVRSALH